MFVEVTGVKADTRFCNFEKSVKNLLYMGNRVHNTIQPKTEIEYEDKKQLLAI